MAIPRIGQSLGWGGNPLYEGLTSNRNALLGLAAGIAGGNSWGEGIANGLANAGQGAVRDDAYALLQQEEAQKQDTLNKTTEWLRQNGQTQWLAAVESGAVDPGTAFSAVLTAQAGGGDNLMSVGGHLYDKTSGQWISPPGDTNGSPRVSLSGQWGRDAQGNPVYLQPSDTGELIPARTPEGVSLLGPYDLNADRAAGSMFGKNTGAAQFDLPAAELTTQQTLSAIQNVRNQAKGMEEQFGNILGIPQQMLPTLPQSERAKFQVETNRLINRTFLEAREVLRGGGQITDFESRKAEGAISNLEEAMTRGDKALFEKSLTDLEQAVSAGYAKLQAQAGSMGGYGATTPTSSGTTSSGVPWSIGGQ